MGWGYLDERQLPRAVFVNKMDRENAQFERVVGLLREVFGGTIVPVFLPIGEGSEFKGVVDVIAMKAYMGEAATVAEIPAGMSDAVEEARTQLVEAAAEGDDELIMKYLDGEELSPAEITRGLRAGIAKQRHRAGLLWFGRQQPGRAPAAWMPWLLICPARPNALPSARSGLMVTRLTLTADRHRPPGGVRVEDRRRSVRRQDLLLPRGLRHIPRRHPRLEPAERQRGAYRSGLLPARQGATGCDRVGRGRYRRCDEAGEHRRPTIRLSEKANFLRTAAAGLS